MGIPTLIKTLTASDSAYLDFVDGTDDVVLDSTYDEYMFVCTDINGTAGGDFQFQVNSTNDAGGDYDTSLITSTTGPAAWNYETGGTPNIGYANPDQAQAAGFQSMTNDCGNGADESCAGILHLFSPASTTYVKHFYSRFNIYASGDYSFVIHAAGYINDASYAIDEIRFKFASGDFDGVIQMYGIA